MAALMGMMYIFVYFILCGPMTPSKLFGHFVSRDNWVSWRLAICIIVYTHYEIRRLIFPNNY